MAVDVVDRQLESYNSHDLESFLACYSRDVTVRDSHGEMLMSGIDVLRREYGAWFTTHPDVRAEVTSRLQSGAWVVDEEHITASGEEMSALVGYHIADGVIDAVLLVSQGS